MGTLTLNEAHCSRCGIPSREGCGCRGHANRRPDVTTNEEYVELLDVPKFQWQATKPSPEPATPIFALNDDIELLDTLTMNWGSDGAEQKTASGQVSDDITTNENHVELLDSTPMRW